MRETESMLPSRMRVLVTGGTGFVGTEITRRLIATGVEVRCLSRRPQTAVAGSIPVSASLFDSGALERAVRGCNAVLHLVGIISEVRDQTFERVHVEGTRRVLAAARATGVTRIVHMSAMGARENAVARYHQTKWAAEELVRHSGLDWTLLRPSLIYGPGDGVVSLFEKLSRFSPVVPVIGSGRSLLQPVAVEDVARLFVESLSQASVFRQTLEVGGPDRISFNQLVEGILVRLHRRRWVWHLPVPLARFQALLMEAIYPTLLGKAPPLNRDQIQMLAEDNVADASATWEEFGFQPVGWESGLDRLLGPRRPL